MKVLLIGCGAVGLSLATALFSAGSEVSLVARGQTAAAIKAQGIGRHGILGEATVPPEALRVYDSVAQVEGIFDYILISAKTTGNADIAKELRQKESTLLNPEGALVLFQNGYGNETAFEDIAPTSRIYHASFAIGFKRAEPHISEVTVMLTPVSIGSIFGADAERCQTLADAIDQGGIPCRLTDDIDKTLWSKLLYNCTLNPLSAILGTNYGGLVKSESSVALMKEIISEIFAVMAASGHTTFWPDTAAYQQDFFENILPPTYAHRSSTLQDIERKIPTEISSLNGAVVRLGEQFGVATPRNMVIAQIIRAMEALNAAQAEG